MQDTCCKQYMCNKSIAFKLYMLYNNNENKMLLNRRYSTEQNGYVGDVMAPGKENNYRRGVASLVILALLKQEDMYGYQLVQAFEEQSGGALTTQEGSLYPVLYKLLEQGYISDYRELVGKRMTRIYYHIEPAGEAHLLELIQEYETVTQGVMRIIHTSGGAANGEA